MTQLLFASTHSYLVRRTNGIYVKPFAIFTIANFIETLRSKFNGLRGKIVSTFVFLLGTPHYFINLSVASRFTSVSPCETENGKHCYNVFSLTKLNYPCSEQRSILNTLFESEKPLAPY